MNLEDEFRKCIKYIESNEYSTENHLSNLCKAFNSLKEKLKDNRNIEIEKYIQYECEALVIYPQSFVLLEYKRRMCDEIDAWGKDQFDYYLERFQTTSSSRLKCQYGDIILDYKGKELNLNKYSVFLKIIPDMHCVASAFLKSPSKNEMYFLSYIGRSVELSLIYSNKEFLEIGAKIIMQFISHIESKYECRWIIGSVKILINILKNHKMKDTINIEFLDLATTKIEESRTAVKNIKNYYDYRNISELFIEWNKITKSDSNSNEIRYEIASSYEWEAADAQLISKQYFYENAAKIYEEIGEKEKLNEMKKLIVEYGRKSVKEMKSIGASIDLPSEKLEAYYNGYRNMENIEHMIMAMLCDSNINIHAEGVREQARKLDKAHPLQALIPSSVLSHDGRKIAATSNLAMQEDFSYRRHYGIHIGFSSMLLVEIQKILREKGLNSEYMAKLYEDWTFMNSDRTSMIKHGFEEFFKNDWMSCLHILVPQFEACLKEMFKLVGISSLVIKEGGIQFEQVLNEFLNRSEVKEGLGIDFQQYIEYVLVCQNGWNMRNDIAHGLAHPDIFNENRCTVIMYMFIKLFNYRIGEKQSD